MDYCQTYPQQYTHAYPSPALSGCYPSSMMTEWNVQNPQESAPHPYNFVTPLDTQQQQRQQQQPQHQHAQRQQFQLPSQHALDYLSSPMPPSPYTPQSLQSPTPPQMPREDSFASSYQSSQQQQQPSVYRQQFAYAPDHASAFPPPPRPVANQPRSRGRAVCIGINYFNQKGEMKGRTDEARNLSSYLQQVKNYTPDSIILLTDDQNGPFGQPTKRNILSALHWLGEHAYQGEHLVLYYSGHGRVPAVGKKNTRTKQNRQDEIETIYPVDFRSFKEGMIKPEELEELLEPVRRKGAKLTLILDTHAGVAGKKGESNSQRNHMN